MTPARLLFCLAAPLLLCACTAVHMREDGPPPSYAPQAEYMTQVALGPCQFTQDAEAASGLAAAILGQAISAGINRIGTALTEAAKEKSLSVKASRNVEVDANSFGPCVQVVRGWFYPAPGSLNTDGDPLAGNRNLAAARDAIAPDFIGAERLRKLWKDNQLWIAAAPDFVFEGVIDRGSGDALAIAPQYVRLNAPLFTRSLRRDPSRHVALFLAFAPAGNAADAQTNPGASFVLGRLVPGETRRYPKPAPLPVQSGQPANRWPHESEWFTLAIGKERAPWTVSAAVTETQDASEFLGFVAGVFGGAKDVIDTEVQNILIPEKRSAARNTAATAKETAATAYDQKQVAALAALDSCALADAPTAAQAGEARVALRELNQAARAAELDVQASAACIDRISITTTATARQACATARARLGAGQPCE